jgi:putative Mg2+ transporter-C (MgtC) family protein
MEGLDWGGALEALRSLRLDLLGRLVLAAALGGVIGIERELEGKPAGFRTNLLICVGAALLTELSVLVYETAGGEGGADPARIAAQIVSGIGFLGAGTIIQSRGTVSGLTTAATLWVVAAIGIAVGAGAWGEAIGATALVIAALLLLGRLERRLFASSQDRVMRVRLAVAPGAFEALRSELADAEADLESLDVRGERGDYLATFVAVAGRDQRDEILRRILGSSDVHSLQASVGESDPGGPLAGATRRPGEGAAPTSVYGEVGGPADDPFEGGADDPSAREDPRR